MKTILVLGAGRSSFSLISYLVNQAPSSDWHVVVGDFSLEAARQRIGNSEHASAVPFNIEDDEASRQSIELADVVVSLLPAHFHPLVARHCLSLKKHLLTASYVSDEMKFFHEEAQNADILFLNECGLDPGIDHMSAMQIIDKIKDQGGKLLSFESFTGGLIAEETEPENPWRYKFTWNPRNIVMAGQGTAKFLQEGQFKYISYQQLFNRTTPIHVPGYGNFEGYANRDSLKYREIYNLQDIKTILRGTLRNKDFCRTWNIFVQLGCCDDTYPLENVESMTHRDFINSFLNHHKALSLEEKIIAQFALQQDGPEIRRLKWSGFFDEEKIGLRKGTPAQILEHILNKKWKLQQNDKDMIVMWHRFRYIIDNRNKEIQASLVVKGADSNHTAMAQTVGLPLGIATKLLLAGKLKSRGVVIPVIKEMYDPVLHELEGSGICLNELEIDLIQSNR